MCRMMFRLSRTHQSQARPIISNMQQHNRTAGEHRFSTELEFLGETRQLNAESLNNRIEEMRVALDDAERSTRTLLALTRLAFLELGE